MTYTRPSSSFHNNPFWLLGVTVRDNRQRIVQRAEERSLELDQDVCQKARTDLTVPRARLGAELSWLPGVAPNRATQLAEDLLRDPLSSRRDDKLPALAKVNLMSSGFELLGRDVSIVERACFLHDIAVLLDELSQDEIRRDVNEDRTVSGFPHIPGDDTIERQLVERRREIRDAVKAALNRLSPSELVATMTTVVDESTESGQRHAPQLIDDLVDSYEVEVHEFLSREAQNVSTLAAAARDLAKRNPAGVSKLLDSLEAVVRNWDRVAQPIQLSAKARGLSHSGSTAVASEIRSLSVDLFNAHELVDVSKRLTALVADVFAEVPVVAEQAETDSDAIDSIVKNRQEWVEAVSYEAEVGVLGRSTLSISPSGATWKDKHFPLEVITRVRWGGVSRSVNGIPTGTTYTIAFGDDNAEAVITLRRSEVYTTFVDKLWRGVGTRLLAQMARSLKAGRTLRMGDVTIVDGSIALKKHKWFGSDQVQCTWDNVHVWSQDGSFVIGSKSDKTVYSAISYINVANTHILEQLIRVAFKQGCSNLSDVLES